MTSTTDATFERTSPYRGLTPYTEDDYAYFFGRGQEITTIVANLAVARLTLFYGPSGVGKTSVLRAGVIHRLRERAQKNLTNDGRPGVIPVYFNRWYQDPLVGVIQAIGDAVERFVAPIDSPVSNSQMFLKQLQEWTQQYNSDLLIVLDQLEEYFFYSKNAGGDDFANALIQAVNSPSLRVNFLLSLREDALARLDHFKGRIPFLLDNRLTIRQLTRDNAQEAIEKPLGPYSKQTGHNYLIEQELTETILKQLISSPIGRIRDGQGTTNQEIAMIEAPYLQLVLSRLWAEEMTANSTVLRLATLNKLQGTTAIVTNYLNDTMAQMSDEDQAMAARFFDRLVTPSGTKIALLLDELNDYASAIEEEDKKRVASLVQTLLQRRILQDVPSAQGQVRYQITHDVLGRAILDWQDRHHAQETEAKRADRILQKARGIKDLDARRQLLREALELVPGHARAQEELDRLKNEEQTDHLYAAATAYIENEQWREALRVLEQIERLMPNFRDTRSRRAEVLGKLPAVPSPDHVADAAQIEYRPILYALLEGRLTPFLGSEVGIGRPAQAGWVKGLYPPSDAEAARDLAHSLGIQVPLEDSLLQVAQYITLFEGAYALYDRLTNLYDADFPPTLLHRLLAEIPMRLAAKGYPNWPKRRYVLFSTAFDELLEQAFAEVGQPYHLFAYRPRFLDDNGLVQGNLFLHYPPAVDAEGGPIEVLNPNQYTGHDSDNYPIIIKLRGRVTPDPDSAIVTEDQYLEYLPAQEFGTLLPLSLLSQIRRNKFLFFGYSLQPWHLRLLWRRLRYQSRPLHDSGWAIVPTLTPIDHEFWRREAIEPIVASLGGVVAYINEWLDQMEARL